MFYDAARPWMERHAVLYNSENPATVAATLRKARLDTGAPGRQPIYPVSVDPVVPLSISRWSNPDRSSDVLQLPDPAYDPKISLSSCALDDRTTTGDTRHKAQDDSLEFAVTFILFISWRVF